MRFKIWLSEVFAEEFGSSDVLSNYSRSYVWMANQLGHMTLGLGVAFLFVWIAEAVAIGFGLHLATYLVAIGILAAVALVLWHVTPEPWVVFLVVLAVVLLLAAGFGLGGALRGIARSILDHIAAIVIFASVVSALVAIIAPVASALLVTVPAAWRRDEPAARGDETGLPDDPLHDIRGRETTVCWWIAAYAIVALAVIVTGSIVSDALAPTATPTPAEMDPRTVAGMAVAGLLVASAILAIGRDGRPVLLAILAVAGAVFLGSGAFADADSTRENVAIVLALAFACAGWVASGGRIVIAIFMVLGAALYFCAVATLTLEADRAGVAAAIASMALWGVKEFGADLPTVRAELLSARAARRRHGADADDQSLRDLECAFVADARQDARTDGAFYVAGAVIALAILTDTIDRLVSADTPGASAWTSDLEVVGFFAFVLLFLSLGRNWTYRQHAVDRAGLRRANRLALFTRAVETVSPRPVRVPLGALKAFARRNGWQDQPGCKGPVNHLIVRGAPGSGRTPLAAAIASEGALADIPTSVLKPPDWLAQVDKAPWTARMLAFATLVKGDGVPIGLNPVMTTEIEILAVDDACRRDDPSLPFRTAAPGKSASGKVQVRRRADVVVIDDADEGALGRALARLSVADGQRTVWMIEEVTHGCASAERRSGAIRDALAKAGAERGSIVDLRVAV